MDTIKLVKLDCGLHWGRKAGSCAKCASGITHHDIAHKHDRALLSALKPVPQSLQDRAIEAARRWNGHAV